MSPFDFLKTITQTKENLMDQSDLNERDYEPFLVNRGLSYYPDTIFYAQQATEYSHLDKRLQYDYLFYAIPQKKRFAAWPKKIDQTTLECVKRVYGYGNEKAIEAMSILKPEQIAEILRICDGGGVKNSKPK